MSYLAIARKYRPTLFDEIVGQPHVVRTLTNAITSGRIHHAYLFTGARGVGKTTAARAFARALNCVNGPTATPCGVCSACKEILAGTCPDLIEIDGASNNSVEDVRDLRETVHYAPTRGGFKVYLVDEVHMLSKAAFNALLKTLEEPPPRVVFIFATTEANKIPETILSRVLRFDFKRIGEPGVVGRLRAIADAEGARVSDAGLAMIARAGEGSMRDAQSLLDKVIAFGGTGAEIPDALVAETLGLVDRGLVFSVLEGLVRGEPGRCLDAIAQVHAYGFELSQLTSELMEMLRNATFARLSEEARQHLDVSADERARLEALVADADAEQLSRLFAALIDVHDQVARAARPRVVLEMAVVRLASNRPIQPLGALLGRLEQVERRLRQAPAPAAASATGNARAASPPQVRSAPEPREAPAAAPARPAAAARSQRSPARPAEPDPGEPDRPAPSPVAVPPPAAAPPSDGAPPRPPGLKEVPPPPPREPIKRPEPAKRADSPEAKWRQLAEELARLGRDASAIAGGKPTLDHLALSVELPAGRALAAARRALRAPDVEAAVQKVYGLGTQLTLVQKAGTGTPSEQEVALRREVLEDPTIVRMIDALGVDLTVVTPWPGGTNG